jgi:hydroxyethylthiazole kinase
VCYEQEALCYCLVHGCCVAPLIASAASLPPLPHDDATAEALAAAKQLAAQHGCVVAVSGAEDLVTDGRRVLRVANGVPMLQQITASGCSGKQASCCACACVLAAAAGV